MAETVLLTGASGFVGRAIHAALLASGFAVEPVGRTAREGWHQADLLVAADRERVLARTRARVLLHAAWYVEHGAFWASPLNEVWRAASADLARGFLAAGGRRIVGLGTCAEYASQGQDGPWREDRPIAPATPYGTAKAGLHADLGTLCAGAGASLLWLRLFHLYGAGEHPARLVPSLMRALAAGAPARVRAAGLVRDFASTLHIGDCVADLLGTRAEGAMNLGSGAPRSLGDLARVLAQIAGRTDLLDLGNAPLPDDPAVMVPDLARLHAAIGARVELPEDGLRQVFTYSQE
ncbi:NAD-dependent epimerase/dehydratase family protein [Paragemmobacter straminiformis]|uniref:NAD-dependent epimerase/dehydratase family protein n=1 Tax=Paragemmobacter straminiformis TaxID=2045119 RepID=A0A842I6V7_9RHOB|nr:NAD-dependent epimerase/dehydratase family protein [Gemmobacter straminiformis]MBC2835812.1 NAD-dependent epimerase/dehydratase family protein [Gemmobacter straminiformis]